MKRVLGRVANVPEGSLVRVSRPPFDVLVTRIGGALFALEDACPHSGASLCEGHLEGHVVTCAAHGWQLDVRTGEVLTEAGRGARNPVFRAVDEDDHVVVYEP